MVKVRAFGNAGNWTVGSVRRSGGKELSIWTEFVYVGQHCDEILIALWGWFLL